MPSNVQQPNGIHWGSALFVWNDKTTHFVCFWFAPIASPAGHLDHGSWLWSGLEQPEDFREVIVGLGDPNPRPTPQSGALLSFSWSLRASLPTKKNGDTKKPERSRPHSPRAMESPRQKPRSADPDLGRPQPGPGAALRSLADRWSDPPENKKMKKTRTAVLIFRRNLQLPPAFFFSRIRWICGGRGGFVC